MVVRPRQGAKQKLLTCVCAAALLLVLEASVSLSAQHTSRQPFYTREVSVVLDNDMFALQDYYYTAGQDFSYKRIVRPNSAFQKFFKPSHGADSSKVIVQYRAGYKIFTPHDIGQTDVSKMDRPYAGWLFASVAMSNFPSEHSTNKYEMELGLVGPSSGMDCLQMWYHWYGQYDKPEGWHTQIRNETIINMQYARMKDWRISEALDLVSQTAIQAGTGSNRISQDFTFRLLDFNPVSNSVFSGNRLSWDTRNRGRNRPTEFFFFMGTGVSYVFSNVFVEGSMLPEHKSQFTVRREPWVLTNRYGVMFSKHDISWSITYFHLSNENSEGVSHNYASLSMAVRF